MAHHNLKANPLVEVEVGTETFTACAGELEADHPLWSEFVAASASLREYEAKTARRIPMLMLTRGHPTFADRSKSPTAARRVVVVCGVSPSSPTHSSGRTPE